MITGNLQNHEHVDALTRVVRSRPGAVHAAFLEPTLDDFGFEFDEDTRVLHLGPMAHRILRLTDTLRCRNTNA